MTTLVITASIQNAIVSIFWTSQMRSHWLTLLGSNKIKVKIEIKLL
jgi:hypothetical protein